METTITCAKEIKPMAEKMITPGKNDLVAFVRRCLFITREDVCKKIFRRDRSWACGSATGGYGPHHPAPASAAAMLLETAIIELV